MAKQFILGKNERLKSRKAIDQLFAGGKKMTLAPYKVLYAFSSADDKPFLRFGTGASSKTFKRAVDRNRIKRLTREAWRLQKNELQEKVIAKKMQVNVFFLYISGDMPVYDNIYKKIRSALHKLTGLMDQ